MNRPTDEQYIREAFNLYNKDGEIEVDLHPQVELPTARVSRSEDGGAYVMAWVWVYDSDIEGFEDPDEESEEREDYARDRAADAVQYGH